jgi:hypothetical protein
MTDLQLPPLEPAQVTEGSADASGGRGAAREGMTELNTIKQEIDKSEKARNIEISPKSMK